METLFLVAILIMSVVIHEVSHGYAADLLGDPTARLRGRLTLNPIKHLDLLGSIIVPALLFFSGGFIFGWAKPVPYNPYNLRAGRWGSAYVAAAGPASNFLIALVFGLVIRFSGAILTPAVLSLVATIVLINIMLGAFNLIPVAPLDGSKILFAALPNRFHYIEAWINRRQFILLIALVFIISQFHFLDSLVFAIFHLFTGT